MEDHFRILVFLLENDSNVYLKAVSSCYHILAPPTRPRIGRAPVAEIEVGHGDGRPCPFVHDSGSCVTAGGFIWVIQDNLRIGSCGH